MTTLSFFDIKVVSTEDSSGNSFQNIPLTFGIEAKATDWLLWRLSIAQDLMDDGDDNSKCKIHKNWCWCSSNVW